VNKGLRSNQNIFASFAPSREKWFEIVAVDKTVPPQPKAAEQGNKGTRRRLLTELTSSGATPSGWTLGAAG
jgi:hypothetical protein